MPEIWFDAARADSLMMRLNEQIQETSKYEECKACIECNQCDPLQSEKMQARSCSNMLTQSSSLELKLTKQTITYGLS